MVFFIYVYDYYRFFFIKINVPRGTLVAFLLFHVFFMLYLIFYFCRISTYFLLNTIKYFFYCKYVIKIFFDCIK